MEELFALVFWVVAIIAGFIFGTANENKHYDSIHEREDQYLNLPTMSLSAKSVSQQINLNGFREARLVQGGVVISTDAFKTLVANLGSFFGGNISVYETLVDRARREATLRLKEQAKGADLIINLKLETSDVGSGSGRKRGGLICVEAFAYATALYK